MNVLVTVCSITLPGRSYCIARLVGESEAAVVKRLQGDDSVWTPCKVVRVEKTRRKVTPPGWRHFVAALKWHPAEKPRHELGSHDYDPEAAP